MRRIAFLICLMGFSACQKESNVLSWQNEFCIFNGKYDARQFSKKELEYKLELISPHFGSYAKTGSDNLGKLYDLTEIQTKSLKDIQDDYNSKLLKISQINLDQSDVFWNRMKSLKIKETQDKYNIEMLLKKALVNSYVLKENKLGNLCPEYIAQINNPDSTLVIKFWKLKVQHADIDYKKYMSEFYLNNNTFQKQYIDAKRNLIVFGWWHCTLEKLADTDTINGMKEFQKLFMEIDQECE